MRSRSPRASSVWTSARTQTAGVFLATICSSNFFQVNAFTPGLLYNGCFGSVHVLRRGNAHNDTCFLVSRQTHRQENINKKN